jgi:uncharacterized damage-inducible protein DinB
VAGDDVVIALLEQERETVTLLEPLDESAIRGLRYAPDKWTFKEVLGHVTDHERMLGHRLLWIARAESAPLPMHDANAFVEHSRCERRSLSELIAEFRAVRQATVALLRGLPADAWQRRGRIHGVSVTVRGLAFHIAGHELHHRQALVQQYLNPSSPARAESGANDDAPTAAP